jgi:GNAT superfamily N-acetyltransferase
VVTRDEPPFTPTEFARARALIELDAQLGPRIPDTRDLLTLPAGTELTVRRADPSDRQAALALHERCSTRTLRLRYHGPVGDADRYIGHLLEPRYGQTLTVETADGDLVALAHLMWDDGSAEIAVLVEDAWQRRGLGAELVRRLAELARDAGIDEVYAVTTSSNTGMVATLRRLGVPLDYQVEEGTLVITAHLAPEPAATRR